MSESTCKTCEFWKGTDGDYPRMPVQVRKCKKVKMFWDSTELDDNEDDPQLIFIDQGIEDLAFVQDASDYKAELITKADFGCVQWKFRTLTESNEGGK